MPEPTRTPLTDDDAHEDDAHGRDAPHADAHREDETGTDPEAHEAEAHEAEPPRTGMTPRQARRIRVVVSAVVMAAVAVILVLRLGNAPSVLTVGFYGIALILSGTAIVLSRRGRTAVATVVLGLGVGAVALAEELLRRAQ